MLLSQVVLDEAFPEMEEGGNSADVRTAIDNPLKLLAVSGCLLLRQSLSNNCLLADDGKLCK